MKKILLGLILVSLVSCTKDKIEAVCDCKEVTETYDLHDNGDGTNSLGWGAIDSVDLIGYDCAQGSGEYVATGTGERKIVICE